MLEGRKGRKEGVIRERSSQLVRSTYRKYIGPNLVSRICVLMIASVNSIIAANLIGLDAVAAITLLTPLFFLMNVFFAVFISGTGLIITRYKSKGEPDKAARAFAALLFNQFVWTSVITVFMFIFREEIIHLITDDKTLVDNALLYYVPWLLFQPLIFTGSCLEAGFATDGRARFFAASAVLNIVLSAGFNLISIFVFDGGIAGLALSSVIAGVVSVLFSCTHFFSRKRTIRLDFSVLKNRKEYRGYLKEQYEIGCSLCVDSTMQSVVGFVINKILAAYGGADAIVCYGVFLTVGSVITAVGYTVENGFFHFSNLFYSDRDLKATKYILKISYVLDTGLAIIFIGLCMLFSDQIGRIFTITDPGTLDTLSYFLFWGSVSCVIGSFSNIHSNLLIATKRNRLSARFNIINNLGVIAGVIAFAFMYDVNGVMLGKTISALIMFILEAVVIYRSKPLFHETESELIVSYSYGVGENTSGEISDILYDLLIKSGERQEHAAFVAVMAEEYNILLLDVNKGRNVNADIRVLKYDDKYCLTSIDNGTVFDPNTRYTSEDSPYGMSLSAKLLRSVSPEASYSRAFDLNVSHHVYRLREKGDEDEN